jgi:hypothetical protein
MAALLSTSDVVMAKKTPAGAIIANEVIVTYNDAKGKSFSNK